ncbi:PAS-domain containing protein [Paracraurococcus lichenis]|uniref:histidine kinase n=1 Tax=Paracraurococcus lichenis TaxID=3064888 RepID=A0ABT9E2X3_9PROT|nr:PAS-domain containing protein [Paracraurococcus sp. LOR1-02]MDO9710516.1 PAS-domain containing protein [Paracraurococcus sp. LOR1-02]
MTQHGGAGAALAAALAGLPLPVWVIGPDRRLAFANAALRQAAGLDPEALPPGTPLEALLRRLAERGLYGPGDPEALACEHLAREHLALDHGQPSRRRLRRTDGTCFEQTTSPLPEGGHVAVLVEIAAPAEVPPPPSGLQRALDSMRHGFILYDAAGRLVTANALAASFCGLTPADLRPGRPFSDLARLQHAAGAYGTGAEADAFLQATLAWDRRRSWQARRSMRDGRVMEVLSAPTPDGGFVITLTDITALAHAEAAGRERADLLQAMLDHLRHGIAVFDRDARVVVANDLCSGLAGLPPGAVRPGRSLQDLVAERVGGTGPDLAPAAAEEVARTLGLDRRRPQRRTRRSAGGRTVEVLSDPLPDGGFVISYIDTTEVTAAKAEIQRRAELLQTMQDSMRHGIALFGPDQRLILANRLAAGLAGVPDAELVPGMTPAELAERQFRHGVFGTGPAAAAEARAVAARDRSRPHPVRRVMPDGRVVDSVSDPTPDGGFVITWTDVTIEVQAEQAAAQRAATLQAMLDTMHHGVVLFGPDHRFLADNRLSRELAGVPEALAQPGTPFAALIETVVASCGTGDPAQDADFARLVRAADRSRPLHYIRPMRDGRTLEVFSDPMPDGGFVLSLSDITPLARAEAEAKQRAATQAVMLDVIRHGIQLFGPDHRLIAANRLAARLSGLPEERLPPGMAHAEILRLQQAAGVFGAGEEAEAMARRLLALDRSQPLRYRRRSPEGRLIEVVSDPTPDGGYAITFSDITALAEAEAAAACRAGMLQAALDNMRHGLLIFGPDRRLTAANALAATMLGLSPEQVAPGLAAAALQGAHGPPEPAAGAAEGFLDLDPARRSRVLRHMPDGRQIEVFTDPTPDGGFVVSCTDITALARAEEEARRHAGMLQAALDSMRHGLMLFGPDRRLLLANRLAGPAYGIPDLVAHRGSRFDDLVRLQHASGHFGEGKAADALLADILALDRGQSARYRRVQPDGRVIEVGSDPTPEGGFVVTHTDVTDLAQAQAEALARASLLQIMLDNMRHGIAQFDSAKRLVTANRLAGELNGIPAAVLRPGVTAAELAAAAMQAGVISPEAVRAAAEDDYGRPQRRIRRHLDGRVIEIFTDPTPDGGFVATYSDITALTEAEAAARQRAGVLQVMLDSMRHGICYYGPDRRVISANALAAELGGFPRHLIETGASIDELIDYQLAAGSVGGDARATAGMARSLDRSRPARYLRPHADGRIIEVTSDPTPDGGFVVTMTDISALARAEAEAQRRAGIQQAMLDNIRHGIALFDADGRIQAVNPVFLALLDLPQEVMRAGGSFAGFIDHLQQRGEYGEGEAGLAVAARLKARDRRQATLSTRTRPNGLVLEIASEPVPGGGWVLALTDVTEDRRIRTELEGAKDAAEAANRAKSRFLATMSHELRTPLNAVIGFSEALGVDPDPERGKDYVRCIHEAGRHLLSLIDDILDVTRGETSGFATVEGEVALVPLVEGAIRVMQATAATAGVTLQAALPQALPPLRADELRLRQVLLNLLSNAVKFTPEGGQVTVSAGQEAGGAVVLRVTDSGIGMRPEDIPRAFEPFTQLDSSLSRRFPGSGLGLYLSKALAEAQGATLTLESVPGAGTTAVLRFPESRLLATLAA